MKRAKVVNCRRAALRIDPVNPYRNEDDIKCLLDKGETVEIYPNSTVYDWRDRLFYKCKTESGEGYIYEGVIDYNG